VRKCVTIKDQSFCKKPILKIHSCEDSFIYINAAVDFVSITNCVNCTIFVAGIRKICAVDKSEKLSMTCSANLIRIGNSLDSHFYTYSTHEPILFGDNKSLFMGPNNANYFEMIDKIKKAEIPFTTKSSINFSYPIIFHEYWNISTNTFSIEQAKDYTVLVLPDEFIPIPPNLAVNSHLIHSMEKSALVSKCYENQSPLIIPFLAPQEYKDKLLEKDAKMKELRDRISKAGLSKEQLLVFANAIQGHYREWLMGRPEYKEIIDIVKWIENESLGF